MEIINGVFIGLLVAVVFLGLVAMKSHVGHRREYPGSPDTATGAVVMIAPYVILIFSVIGGIIGVIVYLF